MDEEIGLVRIEILIEIAVGRYVLESGITQNLQRFYRWGMQEFSLPPFSGPSDPANDQAAIDYVRNYGTVVGNPSLINFVPLTFITDDALTGNDDEDTAFFGEVTWTVMDRLDLTFGVRITADDGEGRTYTETGGFRSENDQLDVQGDPFSGFVDSVSPDPDLGNITTNKFAATYRITDEMMIYGSWGEGFTSGGVTISPNFPDPIVLDPEIVSTREVGLRSDWMGGVLKVHRPPVVARVTAQRFAIPSFATFAGCRGSRTWFGTQGWSLYGASEDGRTFAVQRSTATSRATETGRRGSPQPGDVADFRTHRLILFSASRPRFHPDALPCQRENPETRRTPIRATGRIELRSRCPRQRRIHQACGPSR